MKSRRHRLSLEHLEDRTNPATVADLYQDVWNTYSSAVFLDELVNGDLDWLAYPSAGQFVQSYFTNLFQQANQTISLLNQFPGQMPGGPVSALASMEAGFAQWVGSVFGFSVGAPAATPSAPSSPSVGPVDPAHSTVAVSPASIAVGGTATVTLTAKDANGHQ